MIRKIFSLLFLLIILVGCMSGTTTADTFYTPSTGEILHGLYGGERDFSEERAELKEKSVFFREGLTDVYLKERLVTLIEVYTDEQVIDYFTEAMERNVCSGFGIDHLGYLSVLVYSSATDEQIGELIADFDNLTQSYDTLPVCVRVSDGFTPSVLITLRDYMQTPDLTLLVTRPIYEGEIPAAFAQYEETIRESIYPAYIILLTAFSFSLSVFSSAAESRRKKMRTQRPQRFSRTLGRICQHQNGRLPKSLVRPAARFAIS